MIWYIVRRIAQSIGVMFLVSTLLFLLLLYFEPGGPCAAISSSCSASQLGVPAIDQYLGWLGGVLHGNFGTTASSNGSTTVPVTSYILARLPATILLVAVSFPLQQLIALPLGIFAAVRRYSALDQFFTVLSYVGLSVPAFVLGLILIYLFPVELGVFAAGRTSDILLPLFWSPGWFAALWRDPGYVLGDLMQHLVLPAITLAAVGIAADSRFMRASMLEVLGQEYIRTARAKGVSSRVIIFKHALRNALLPVVTNMALTLPALLTSVVVVETVFTWDGVGYLFATSVQGSDVPTIQALVLLSTAAVVLANLIADLAHAWIDPRIRYD